MSFATYMSHEERLSYWAACLGWNGLKRYESTDRLPPFVWYECGDNTGERDHFALHISVGRRPTNACRAAVYAIRYRIMSGWHEFTLYRTTAEIEREARRLDGWLHRKQFSTTVLRRKYRLRHPECAACSWKRLREAGEPKPGRT